jgi:hypothetical protein
MKAQIADVKFKAEKEMRTLNLLFDGQMPSRYGVLQILPGRRADCYGGRTL